MKKLAERPWQVITAVPMTMGRGRLARAAGHAADLAPAGRVIDGPGRPLGLR